ncbi:GNAT family N-acetyltransferase [Paenibacillus sp. MMO-177]|uniref:GNAT family N-acetyltransferase n=1 Tax=Paenibacillus sp. MMO-177 TaxID=3081289 RepID=UPI0030199F6B
MILFSRKEISLRTLESEDAGLLVRWLNDPAVLEFYEGRDRPQDAALVQKHFYEDREEIIPCIIQYNGADIGYLQFYEIQEEEREIYGLSDEADSLYGMDQFIGEPRYWNKGIGSELIKETVQYLIKERGARKIVMDPQAWNTRALRVYEKSGFKKVKLLEKHEWHEGEYRDCWLIVYDPGDALSNDLL